MLTGDNIGMILRIERFVIGPRKDFRVFSNRIPSEDFDQSRSHLQSIKFITPSSFRYLVCSILLAGR